MAPKGGKPFDAWFDTQTHLLTRMAEERQFIHYRETYSEYSEESGAMLPHKVVCDTGLGPDGIQVNTLIRLNKADAQPTTAFSMPQSQPRGATIDSVVVLGTRRARGRYTRGTEVCRPERNACCGPHHCSSQKS